VQAEAEDAEYPDEVDTPQDVAARVRFARYRGLKSFRSSPWDARDGLPAEYGRVFAFENFKRTAKRAREAAVSSEGLARQHLAGGGCHAGCRAHAVASRWLVQPHTATGV
jgi:pre-rRNA-processing protein TSR1